MVEIVIRPGQPSDLDTLHIINQAAVPGVGSVARADFARLVTDRADKLLVAVRGDKPLGFVLCMVEGNGHSSLNYQWISKRYASFAYVDRVAVAEDARSFGVGGLLYDAVIRHYRGNRPVLTAEVNLEPPNPGSLRFHERNGFTAVGERWEDDRSKGVVYLERGLSGLSED